MPKPEEYKYIRAWGKWMKSFDYYIQNEQRKAAASNAPLTATFQDFETKEWRTIENVINPDLRDELVRLANEE